MKPTQLTALGPVRTDYSALMIPPVPFLQAVVDDSASEVGDKRVFLAGFVQSAENWARFCSQWSAELAAGKPIDYLKMSEANSFEGEFQGWYPEERDKKLERLRDLISSYNMLSFHSSLSRTDDYPAFKAISPRGLGSPHFISSISVISGLARYLTGEGPCEIEFIFDSQDGVDDDVELFFERSVKGVPEAARKSIRGKPKFWDDKVFVALQAADMLAWHLRRRHEKCGSWEAEMSDFSPIGVRHLLCGDVDQYLAAWTADMAKMPGINGLQTKPEWRKIKRLIRHIESGGNIERQAIPLKRKEPVSGLAQFLRQLFLGMRKGE